LGNLFFFFCSFAFFASACCFGFSIFLFWVMGLVPF
jgi:hypothetical protein